MLADGFQQAEAGDPSLAAEVNDQAERDEMLEGIEDVPAHEDGLEQCDVEPVAGRRPG